MDLFEFLLVVVSIVLGLAITELLAGAVRILRGELLPGRLHSLWILIVLQLQVQLAWGLWGLRDREAWTYAEFLLLLAGPGLLYMAAAVLFPSVLSDEPADAHLLRRRRPFFLLIGSYVLATQLFGWFLFEEGWQTVPFVVRLVPFTALVVLAWTEKRAVQWALSGVILAGHIWWTYVFLFVVDATPVAR